MESKDLQISAREVTLRMLVEARLREAICSGLFKPGRRLVERQAAVYCGVPAALDSFKIARNVFAEVDSE
jgi:4-carboxymuconolactone decarboxylase